MSTGYFVAVPDQVKYHEMPVSLPGVTDACGLPPVKFAHKIVAFVGVAVAGMVPEGQLQVPSYWLLVGGVQVPNVGFAVAGWYWTYQAVVMVSSAVPTLRLKVLGAGIEPEMVIEIPLNAEASNREQMFQYRPMPE